MKILKNISIVEIVMIIVFVYVSLVFFQVIVKEGVSKVDERYFSCMEDKRNSHEFCDIYSKGYRLK